MSTNTIDLAGTEGRVDLDPARLDVLAAQLEGPLLRAGDEGWDDAVLLWNGMVATTPAIVVQPTSPEDVAAAVSFARERRQQHREAAAES